MGITVVVFGRLDTTCVSGHAEGQEEQGLCRDSGIGLHSQGLS